MPKPHASISKAKLVTVRHCI